MALVHPARFSLELENCYSNNYSNFSDSSATAEYVFHGILVPVVAVFGIVVNVFIICILYRPQFRSVVDFPFSTLASFDILVLLLAITIFPNASLCANFVSGCPSYIKLTLVTYPLSQMAFFGSIWTCVLIVVYSFRVEYYFTSRRGDPRVKRNSLFIVIVVLFSGFLYCIPTMFELKINAGSLEATELRQSPMYEAIYRKFLYLILLLLLPVIVIISLGTLVTRSVCKTRDKIFKPTLNVAGNWECKQKKYSIASMVTAGSFLFFNLLGICNNVVGVDTTSCVTQQTAVAVGNLLVCFSCSTKFLAYWYLLPNFKHIFVSLFCPCITPYLSSQYQFSGYYQETNGETFGIISMRKISKQSPTNNNKTEEDFNPTVSPLLSDDGNR